MWVRPLGQKDCLEEEVATHSSIPAWKIPWKRSLVGYSPWSQQESGLSTHAHSLSFAWLPTLPQPRLQEY